MRRSPPTRSRPRTPAGREADLPLPTAAAIQALSIPGLTGTGEAAFLTALIATADAALAEGICLFPPATPGGASTLEATSRTRYFDGPNRSDPSVIRTHLRPIVSVTSVKQDTAGDESYATTESSDDYAIDRETGELRAKRGSSLAWISGPRAIQVVLVAGFDVGAHAVLTMAIGLLVSHWMTTRRSPAIVSASQGGQSVSFSPKEIPIQVRELVWPYRLTGLER